MAKKCTIRIIWKSTGTKTGENLNWNFLKNGLKELEANSITNLYHYYFKWVLNEIKFKIRILYCY